MFYLFKYLDYFIKTMIRSFVYKPKRFLKFLLFVIIFILLFIFITGTGVFAAETDIFTVYNSINQDLINRLDKGNTNKGFYNYLNSVRYNFLVYYGNPNGSDMYNSSYNTSKINVAFYPVNSQLLNFETTDTKWGGVQQSKAQLSSSNISSVTVFVFDENGSYFETGVDQLMIPPSLFNYSSPAIFEYIREQKNVQDITNSITDSTDKINNSITDSTVSDDSMNVDTSNMNFEDKEGVDNFFTFLLNFIKDSFLAIDDTVEIIELPMPYTNSKIILRSDMVSSFIKGTILETYINLFWYFIFGTALIMFSFRIISWFTSGKLAEEGVYSLSEYLEFNNIIIKASMM